MIITSDDKTIFTADRVNVLKQWNIEKRQLLKDWKQVHPSFINAMLLNADNTSILIAGDCSLKEWKVDLTPSNILFRDWGDIHGNNQITCMSLSKPINDSKTGGGNNSKMSPSMANNMKFLFKLIQILFTGDHLGNVKVWNYETQECIKALDDIHCAELSFVKLTQDYKYV